jgi:hypothetical protein
LTPPSYFFQKHDAGSFGGKVNLSRFTFYGWSAPASNVQHPDEGLKFEGARYAAQ